MRKLPRSRFRISEENFAPSLPQQRHAWLGGPVHPRNTLEVRCLDLPFVSKGAGIPLVFDARIVLARSASDRERSAELQMAPS